MKQTCAVVFAFLFGLVSVSAADFVLSTADTAPYSNNDNSGYYDQIIIEAFERAGHTVTIRHNVPSRRSITDANNNRIDGEFARITGLAEIYPNLVRVDVPLTFWTFNAFTRSTNVAINSFDDLASYNIAYINGWVIYEQNVGPYRSLTTVENEEQLFSLLFSGRVDVVLYNRLRGNEYLRNHNRTAVVSPPLVVRPMYLYMNSSNADTIPALETALKEMIDDGWIGARSQEILGVPYGE